MKRVLVVDDERPVVDAVGLMIRRDLSGEFAVAGEASSGREAIEKAASLAPDIVLMDIWMPGISGLEAVREIRGRGLPCVFILITAYERFDIAREAMELGVLDYLLKPVARDKLAAALRNAASFSDRRFEIERLETRHREREGRLQPFVEEALFRALVMEPGPGFAAARYAEALGLADSAFLVVAVAFLPPGGSPDADAEALRLYGAFRSTVRYKTRALVGPFMSGCTAVLISLAGAEEEPAARENFARLVGQAHGDDLGRNSISMGFSGSPGLSGANRAWTEALRRALGGGAEPGDLAADDDADAGADASGGPSATGWEGLRPFVGYLLDGDHGNARAALDGALRSIQDRACVPRADRYRLIALFAEAYGEFLRKGLLSPEASRACMDLEDIRAASGGPALALAARARFGELAEASRNAPRWSATVAKAIAFMKRNYGRQISLESVAAEIPVSPNHLSRLFVEETGRGFSECLIELRINRAKELLAEPGASIKQVSAECGYPDPNYFSRLFKKVTGLTPSAFSSEPREGSNA